MIKIIGFNFNKIAIEKKKDVTNEAKISTNVDIDDVKKVNIDLFKDKDAFNIKYSLKFNYKPDFVDIEFNGNIVVLIDNSELVKKTEEKWKSKELPLELKTHVMNIILSKCNLKALQLEEELNVPLHMPAPRVDIQKKE